MPQQSLIPHINKSNSSAARFQGGMSQIKAARIYPKGASSIHERFGILSATLISILLPFVSYGQASPITVNDYHIINDSEPALIDLLDSGDRFGRDFNPLGDLDLDGVPDFLVGARSDDDGATDAGAVYVLFMNPDGSVKSYSKISATSGGLTAAGVTLTAGQFFGYGVTTIGDLDGDSIQDIAVGARRNGATADGGVVYITFMNRDGTVKAIQPISNSTGNLGHTLANSDFFGESVTILDTIDGAPTIAVSNTNESAGGQNQGSIFILRLNPDGTAMTGQTVKISNTSGGFSGGLATGDRFGGRDIAPLGDIDGDGNLDIVVAAFGTDDGRGAIWILRLNSDFTVKASQKIGNASGGLQATLNADDNFGHAVFSPGDIDGDGVSDLITSANKSDLGGTDTGEVYFLLLNSDGTVKAETRMGATSNTLPFTLPTMGRFGRTLCNLGDLADNGTRCIAVGGGAGSTGVLNLLFLTFPVTPLLTDPRAISGNVLWLDGSDPDGDFITGGGFSGGDTWVDKSSAANADAIQTVVGDLPTVLSGAYNGLSAVHFDGDAFMDVDSLANGMARNTAGLTIFAIARPTQPSSGGGYRVFMISNGLSSASTRAGFSFYDNFGAGLEESSGDVALNGRRLDSDAYQRINGGAVNLTDFVSWTGEFDYAHGALRLYREGELITSTAAFQTLGNTSDTDSFNIRLGADASLSDRRGFFTGDLAELIVYDRVLSPSERQLVEAWLASKWTTPELDISIDNGEAQVSWPVSPAAWSPTISTDLGTPFTPPSTATYQESNRIHLEEPASMPQMFFRLER